MLQINVNNILAAVVKYGVAFVAGVSVVLLLCSSPVPQDAPRTPYTPPGASELEKVGQTTLPTEIVVYKPTVREQKKIDKALGGKKLGGPIIASADIKELCNGGKIFVSLEPVEFQGETVDQAVITVVPSPPKLVRFKNELSLFVGGIKGWRNGYDGVMNAGVVRIEYDSFNLRNKIDIHTEAGWMFGGDYDFKYVSAGVRLKIR